MAQNGATVANAWVQIMPSFEGASEAIANGLDAAAAGDAAGKTLGEHISGHLKSVAAAALLATGVKSAVDSAVGFVKDSVMNAGMTFDASMSQVVATMGYSVEEINTEGSKAQGTFLQLRDFAQEMGSSTAFSASEAAQALNYMALAGYDAQTSMDMLPTVLDLAAAGGMELATASDMVTDASSALGLSIGDTSTLVDEMAKAASRSNTSVAQLGDAILTVGGTAKTMNGGMGELADGTQFAYDYVVEMNTALGILANNGIKGSEGGTHLRNMILSLSSPTDVAAKKMKELGVEVFDNEGHMRSMNDIFTDLNGSLGELSESERADALSTIFNKTDLSAANAMLSNAGENFDSLAYEISNCTDAASEMANVQLDNLFGDETMFKSAKEGFQIAISDMITPAIRQFYQFGAEALSQMTVGLQDGGVSGLISTLDDIIVQGLERVADAFGFGDQFRAACEAIQPAIDGISGAFDWLGERFDALGQVGDALQSAFVDVVKAGFDVVQGVVEYVAGIIGDKSGEIGDAFGSIGDKLNEWGGNFDTVMADVAGVIEDFGSGIGERVPAAVDVITDAIERFNEGPLVDIENGFAAAKDRAIEIKDQLEANLPAAIDTAQSKLNELSAFFTETVLPAFESVKSYISENFNPSFTDIQKAVTETAQPAFQAVSDFIGNTFLPALQGVPSLINDVVIPGFTSAKDTLEQVFAPAFGIIKDAIDTSLLPSITGAMNTVTSMGEGFDLNLGSVKDLFTDVFTFIAEHVSSKIEIVSGVIDGIVKLFSEGVGPALPELQSAFETAFSAIGGVIEAFDGIWQTMVDLLGPTIAGLAPVVEEALGFVADFIENSLSPAIQGVADWLNENMPAIEALITEVMGNIAPTVQTVWEFIETVITEAWGIIQSAIETTLPIITDLINVFLSATSGDWSTTWEFVQQLVSDVWNGIDSTIGNVIDAVVGVVEGFVNGVKTSFDTWGISTIIESVWNGIQLAITQPVQLVTSAVSGFVTGIKNAFSAWGIDGIVSTIWTALKGFIDDPIGTLTTTIGQFVANIKTALQNWGIDGIVSGIWTALKGFIDDPIGTLTSGISTFISSVKTAFTNWGIADVVNTIWTNLKKFIDDPIGTLSTTVSNFISAIKKAFDSWGISDVVNTIWTAIKGFIDDPIGTLSTTVGNFISSVKNAFDGWGVDSIIETLWQSVQSFIEDPINAAKNTVDTVIGAISGFFDGWDIGTVVSNAVSSVQSFLEAPFTAAQNTIEGIPDAIIGFFTGIGDSISNAIGSISFPTPHINWSDVDFFGMTVSIPTVEFYAKGGVFDGAQLIGVGEAGAEAVIPLENSARLRPFVTAIAEELADVQDGGGGGTVITGNNFYIRDDRDIEQVARELYELEQRESRRLVYA